MIKQRTLKNVITAKGIGVHKGEEVVMTLRPAPPDHGIIFRRVDLEPVIEIPANAKYISETDLSTGLSKDGASVSTVEHLLSALAGLGIDNLYVDLTASELPIMDGSANPFVFLIQSAGIECQEVPKKFIRIIRKIEVTDGDKVASLEPYDGFKINFSIEYKHPLFNELNQTATFDFSSMSYTKELARARTYGFLSDYEYITKKGLALGASLDNALVFDQDKILNKDGLRYPDECVKHKILDVIGDLFLLGHRFIGCFSGYKSGHSLNSRLLKYLLSCQDHWELITVQKKDNG